MVMIGLFFSMKVENLSSSDGLHPWHPINTAQAITISKNFRVCVFVIETPFSQRHDEMFSQFANYHH
jgi:hypothetical protein